MVHFLFDEKIRIYEVITYFQRFHAYCPKIFRILQEVKKLFRFYVIIIHRYFMLKNAYLVYVKRVLQILRYNENRPTRRHRERSCFFHSIQFSQNVNVYISCIRQYVRLFYFCTASSCENHEFKILRTFLRK